MKNKEITSTTIKTENEIILLSENRKRIGDEIVDIKDLMRKVREK
jgi:hypothetical protein